MSVHGERDNVSVLTTPFRKGLSRTLKGCNVEQVSDNLQEKMSMRNREEELEIALTGKPLGPGGSFFPLFETDLYKT